MYQPSMGQEALPTYGRTVTAPGAPPPPPGNPPPGGTYYAPPQESTLAAETYAAADAAYKRSLARLNTQRTGILRQYGYLGDVDPTTGQVKNVRVDAGNSFGQLQQLLHGQALEDMNAENAAEDRGLRGGLAHQAEAELHYEHQGQTGNLVNQLMANLAGYDDQQQQAQETLDQALFDLQHSAVQTAADNGEHNPAPPPTGGGGGGGSQSKAQTVAQKVAAASEAAFKAAGGHSSPAAALAARSAGLNALYGLGKSRTRATHRPLPNAYTSGRKKRG